MEEEQSKEPRMGARRDGGAVVRVERRRNWSDEEKLAILKETTQPGAIAAAISVDRLVDPQALRLVLEIVGELER